MSATAIRKPDAMSELALELARDLLAAKAEVEELSRENALLAAALDRLDPEARNRVGEEWA